MKIAFDERETVISWLDCENEVDIYTCSPVIFDYVTRNGGPQPTKVEADKEGPYSWWWKLPKERARKVIALFTEAMVEMGIYPPQNIVENEAKSA